MKIREVGGIRREDDADYSANNRELFIAEIHKLEQRLADGKIEFMEYCEKKRRLLKNV